MLVRRTPDIGADRRSVQIGGQPWVLTTSAEIPSLEDAVDYVCVSYAWGDRTTPHPFNEHASMSDRTMPALEATARSQHFSALWVDAFCIPLEEPARAQCLRWMGAIFARASRAVVVLSEPCAVALEQIRATQGVEAAALPSLDDDPWVTRAWTYQELVNARSVRFVAEGRSTAWADGDELLDYVGHAVKRYGEEHGLDVHEIRAKYRRLDGLEDLLLDWKTADYMERSAYQAVSSMHRREAGRPDDHFNAMVGAISPAPTAVAPLRAEHPADHFMRVCEANGDYSFIYTAGPRSTASGRGWRPVAVDRFQAVLPWHSFGEGQSAKVHSTHIELNGMWRLRPRPTAQTAIDSTERWLRIGHADHTQGDVATRLLARLRLAGFLGCGEYMELAEGFFYSQSPLPTDRQVVVAVATGVRMVHGAPALLLREGESEIHDLCDVGVFIGKVPDAGDVICVR
ncbi:MAG: HET domain-containing protein [Deltaproteobacteria bacterium]|nr:HET domain-containing protein [Deltaproteobacteria bacterium]MCB9788356.1 HET domain-containing protein [Deltaproteobacteria bacterium]